MNEIEHKDDYNGSFRDVVWLQSFPLNIHTVLHYFSLSQFYDKSCNNERLKMQRRELDQLKTMRGVEYELLLAHPAASDPVTVPATAPLFLIRKQRRRTPTQIKPLAIYYVVDGTIYQAPNIHAMLTSRLKKCSYRVNEAFHALAAGVRFSQTEGYSWDFSTEKEKKPQIPSEQLSHRLKKLTERHQKKQENSKRVYSILEGLLKKFTPDMLEKNNPIDKLSGSPSNTAADGVKLEDQQNAVGGNTSENIEENSVKRQRLA